MFQYLKRLRIILTRESDLSIRRLISTKKEGLVVLFIGEGIGIGESRLIGGLKLLSIL